MLIIGYRIEHRLPWVKMLLRVANFSKLFSAWQEMLRGGDSPKCLFITKSTLLVKDVCDQLQNKGAWRKKEQSHFCDYKMLDQFIFFIIPILRFLLGLLYLLRNFFEGILPVRLRILWSRMASCHLWHTDDDLEQIVGAGVSRSKNASRDQLRCLWDEVPAWNWQKMHCTQ